MQHNSFTQKISNLVLRNKITQRTIVAGAAVLTTIGGASAETINTTAITGVLTDMGNIMPSLGNFVISVVPTLMELAVVGFVLAFFGKILGVFDKVI